MTEKQKKIQLRIKKLELRIKKLESILLYDKWVNRCPSELYMDSFELWLKVRNLRIEKEKGIKTKNDNYFFTKKCVKENEEYEKKLKKKKSYYIPEELKDVNTRTILNGYLSRSRYYNEYWDEEEYDGSVVLINGVRYDEDLIKYILDNREHINRKRQGKVTPKHKGKKDKRLGKTKLR